MEERISHLRIPKFDMTGKKCEKCKSGTYRETTFFDDTDGVLHCTACDHAVRRWRRK